MRTKTNFQAVQELIAKFVPVQSGVVSMAEISIIRNTLELDGRNDLELQDIRDMAVALYGQSAQSIDNDATKNDAQKLKDVMVQMDAMSAVTSVIDQEIFARSQPGNKISIHAPEPGYAIAIKDNSEFLTIGNDNLANGLEFDPDPSKARLFRTPNEATSMACYIVTYLGLDISVVRIETCRTVFPEKTIYTKDKNKKGGNHSHGEEV